MWVSRLCCGNEYLHEELRARCLCELHVVLHKEWYLTDDKISTLQYEGDMSSKARGKNAVVVASKNFEKGSAIKRSKPNLNIAHTVFDIDCRDTARLGCYANMWHVHALASVIGQPIHSIYPNFHKQWRPAFNKTAIPRESTTPHMRKFTILWTRRAQQTGELQWSPNHFVPCFSRQFLCAPRTIAIPTNWPLPSDPPLPGNATAYHSNFGNRCPSSGFFLPQPKSIANATYASKASAFLPKTSNPLSGKAPVSRCSVLPPSPHPG